MTNQIPIIVPPEEDEYLYSYVCRLAKINGFASVNGFIYSYIADDLYDQEHDVSYIVRRYCKTMYIPKFAEALGEADNIVSLYNSLSLYPCLSVTMLPNQQVMQLNYIFRSKRDFADFLGRTRSVNDSIKYCPECEREQVARKGYFWVKRAHQLPGVNVCHKHSCLLNEYTGNPYSCFYNDALEGTTVTGKLNHHTCEYARFVDSINNSNIKVNKNDLKQIFYRRFSDIESNSKHYESALRDLGFNKSDKEALLRDLLSGRLNRITDIQVLTAMYLIFTTFDVFHHYVSEYYVPDFNVENYKVIGEYNPNISLIQHECGHKFVGTEYGINVGWGCPECLSQYSQKDFAMHLFHSSYKSGYSLEKPYQEGDTSLHIRHDICGQVKEISFRELLKRTDCKCLNAENAHLVKNGMAVRTNVYKTPEIKKEEQNIALDKEGSEFRIIEYTDSMGPAKIYHSVCGETFEVPRWSRFALRKKCPCCIEKEKGVVLLPDDLLYKSDRGKVNMNGNLIHGAITEKKDFVSTMKTLVGDDYELISEYKNSSAQIIIKHNVCGQTFMTTGSRFCNGQRCKCETFYTNDEDFMDEFRRCTDDCYEISKAPYSKQNYFRIIEKATGKEATLSKAQLTQELNRVTPSKILNNEHRHRFKGNPRAIKRVYMKMLYSILLDYADKDGVFSLKEIQEHCDYSITQLYKAMRSLKNRNVVEYAGVSKHYRILNDHLYSF